MNGLGLRRGRGRFVLGDLGSQPVANMAKSLRPPPPDPDVGLAPEAATKLINERGYRVILN